MDVQIIVAGPAPRKAPAAAGDRTALERIRGWGGDPLVRKLGRLFEAEAGRRIAAAREGARCGDAAELRRAAHALRSSSGQLGARGMQAVCEQIEVRAARGEVENAGALVGTLENELGRYREWLATTLLEMETKE